MAKRAKKTTVFLIIDDRIQRESLATDLQAAGYLVHDYMTAREFLIDKRYHSSGVVVADYRLQEMNGLELGELLTDEQSDFPVVLIVGPADIPNVLAASVSDLIVKPVNLISIQDAITRAMEGEEYTEVEINRAFRKLTSREREIASLVVGGKSSREIGEILEISTKTVEAHRARIMDKTRADDVGHLMRLWRAWNQ